ncbi:HD domain-containing protein, partial [Singulisphaera rosea]
MHDRFKKRYQSPQATPRLRRQIAAEAARRLFDAITPSPVEDGVPKREATESQCYAAKRKAAAVLGHKV